MSDFRSSFCFRIITRTEVRKWTFDRRFPPKNITYIRECKTILVSGQWERKTYYASQSQTNFASPPRRASARICTDYRARGRGRTRLYYYYYKPSTAEKTNQTAPSRALCNLTRPGRLYFWAKLIFDVASRLNRR